MITYNLFIYYKRKKKNTQGESSGHTMLRTVKNILGKTKKKLVAANAKTTPPPYVFPENPGIMLNACRKL